MAKRPVPPADQPPDLDGLLAECEPRLVLPCCGWVIERTRLVPERRLRVCGRCGHWLMDFGDGMPSLLTQVEIEELPEKAPRHAAEMIRLTARLVDEAPCCKRALGNA